MSAQHFTGLKKASNAKTAGLIGLELQIFLHTSTTCQPEAPIV